MSLTLAIPAYTLDEELEAMTLAAIASYRDQVDEVVVVEDGGRESEWLRLAADTYLWHPHEGFTRNFNRAWRLATSDYALLANSDTRLVEGDPANLCLPGRVTSPAGLDAHRLAHPDDLWGACFVVPRDVAARRGRYDERLRTYMADVDYMERTRDLYTFVPTVTVEHLIARTCDKAGFNWRERLAADTKIFAGLYAARRTAR